MHGCCLFLLGQIFGVGDWSSRHPNLTRMRQLHRWTPLPDLGQGRPEQAERRRRALIDPTLPLSLQYWQLVWGQYASCDLGCGRLGQGTGLVDPIGTGTSRSGFCRRVEWTTRCGHSQSLVPGTQARVGEILSNKKAITSTSPWAESRVVMLRSSAVADRSPFSICQPANYRYMHGPEDYIVLILL